MGKYRNLKVLVADYVNGCGLDGEELKKRIQEAYDEDEISGHEYDDLMQYMED